MKITLIGGSGFVGTRLIDLLRSSSDSELQNIDKQQSHFFPGFYDERVGGACE